MDGDRHSATYDAFLNDVLAGLSQAEKSLPARWFYDAEGSRLFDLITQLPEYYPTRTELGILEQRAGDMAQRIGPDALIVEYGAGSLVKIRYLLDALERPAGFVPVDISETHLKHAADKLREAYPGLAVHPVAADFMRDSLRLSAAWDGRRKVGFFPGSTIGNLSDPQIHAFLTAARKDLGADGLFLIGVDQPKSPELLLKAYDDAQGVTAAFNLNLLARINRELGGDFDIDQFRHKAVWNAKESRIEMHLKSLVRQTAHIQGRSFEFAAEETIHTENSRKIPSDVFANLAEKAGWRIIADWRDDKNWFAMILLA